MYSFYYASYIRFVKYINRLLKAKHFDDDNNTEGQQAASLRLAPTIDAYGVPKDYG